MVDLANQGFTVDLSDNAKKLYQLLFTTEFNKEELVQIMNIHIFQRSI